MSPVLISLNAKLSLVAVWKIYTQILISTNIYQITYSFVTALTSAVLFFLTHSEPEKNLPEAQEINMINLFAQTSIVLYFIFCLCFLLFHFTLKVSKIMLSIFLVIKIEVEVLVLWRPESCFA